MKIVSIDSGAYDSYSVEISHIYLDQPFSSDQLKSVEKFHDEEARKWDYPHAEIVLFDDYNITQVITSSDEVLDKLEKLNATPKYFAFEKDLIHYSQYFLDHVTVPKIKRQYEKYIESNGKYPCSLLTSIWYLIRLGYILDSKGIIKSREYVHRYEPASKLINFLPIHFAEVEEKSRKLIQVSEFSQAVSRIENIFFESKETDSVLKKDLA